VIPAKAVQPPAATEVLRCVRSARRMLAGLRRLLETTASRCREAVLRVVADQAAPLIRYMAETGVGADRCLGHGCLPVRVHYYSPVPDIADLDRRDVWSRRSALAGIEWDEDEHLRLMQELADRFGHECEWPHDYVGDDTQYYTGSSGFSFGCAALTHSLIRSNKPRKVIEIGSGSSTKVIAAALRKNRSEGISAEYVVVDPHAGPAIVALGGVNRVISKPVEEVEIGEFAGLAAGDVLFVDSSHTVRIGGDVNYLILDVLPILAPGVVVHFHDIPMPFEYASAYYHNPKFRVFWTESYLLQAFLIFNRDYKILLPMNNIFTKHQQAFQRAWPHYIPRQHVETSHSFWILRAT
jgi:Methyltransferase domain